MSLEEVTKAAKFLDSAVGAVDDWLTADWRQKVNVNDLAMSSMVNCILGQLHDNGFEDAANELEDWNKTECRRCEGSFASFTDDWKKYLTASPTHLRIGQKWHTTSRDSEATRTILGINRLDGDN